MIVKSIELKNYRNYKNKKINFENELNLIIGSNGVGKTNLVEALYYCSTCKSHRVSTDKTLIYNNENYCDIRLNVEKKGNNHQLRIFLNENGKTLFINNQTISKVSEYIGFLNAILFSPDDLNLFIQTPKVRRKFVDIEIGKLSSHYTFLLNSYYKLLKDRNLYLKSDNVDKTYLKVMTMKMIDYQLLIVDQIKKFNNDLLKYENTYFNLIKNDFNEIQCEYLSNFNNSSKETILNYYDKYFEKDIRFKQTILGIHKDDFLFKVDGKNITEHLSQSQKKIVLLCLKLGLINLIYQINKDYPIIILDDLFSDFDEINQEKILQYIPKGVQIFITTCVQNFKKNNDRSFNVIEISK